jgi:uncharacterized protein
VSLFLVVILVLFFASLIKVVLGFGEALVAMPVLTLMIGIHTATPLVGLVSITLTALVLLQHRQHIEVSRVWRLVIASGCGVPFGLMVLRYFPAEVAIRLLGLLIVLYSLYSLFQPRLHTIRHPLWGYGLAFSSGLLGTAYSTGGPPMVVYTNAQDLAPEAYQGMLQSFFLPSNVLIVSGHALSGLWTGEVLTMFLLTLPIMLLAFGVGNAVSHYIPKVLFSQFVRAGLLVLGLVLLF